MYSKFTSFFSLKILYNSHIFPTPRYTGGGGDAAPCPLNYGSFMVCHGDKEEAYRNPLLKSRVSIIHTKRK